MCAAPAAATGSPGSKSNKSAANCGGITVSLCRGCQDQAELRGYRHHFCSLPRVRYPTNFVKLLSRAETSVRLCIACCPSFCCCHQKDRNGDKTSNERALFSMALDGMGIWYCHINAYVLKCTKMPEGWPHGFETSNKNTYHNRGNASTIPSPPISNMRSHATRDTASHIRQVGASSSRASRTSTKTTPCRSST